MKLFRLPFLIFLELFWLEYSLTSPINEEECGTITVLPFLRNRVMGGERSPPGDVPWIAYIKIPFNQTHVTMAAGSLINKLYVLTVAHAFSSHAKQQKHEIRVYLGITDIKKYSSCRPYCFGYGENECTESCNDGARQFSFVSEIITHESFNYTASINDVALLRLSRKAKYTDYVRPICIPTENTLSVDINVGDNAMVAGWGCTNYTHSVFSDYLHQATVSIHSVRTCGLSAEEWGSRALCAGEVNRTDACDGDSGAPLTKVSNENNANREFLLGIMSGNRDRLLYPSFYAKSSYYVEWIWNKIKDDN